MPKRYAAVACAVLAGLSLSSAALAAPASAESGGASAAAPVAPAAEQPIPVRVVVVTAFEIGDDTGDMAGEFQAWAEAYPRTLAFPAGERDLRYDPKAGVLVLSTGIGTARATASVMALGLDPRFDLSKAYWLVAAIAGVNPNEASVGSAAWIGQVVDTDYGYEIDAREIPADWPTGRLPWDRTEPYRLPVPVDTSSNLFALNEGLRDWAYGLTSRVALPDTETLRTIRRGYTGHPKALLPPVVTRGDEATGQTFWHGELLNRYAEQWTRYWTGGSGRFVMTAMEDSGVARALDVLGRLDRVDPERLLVLRTASNYTLGPVGIPANESLRRELRELSALSSALDSAYRVARPVVDELTTRWPRYADRIPGSSAPAD